MSETRTGRRARPAAIAAFLLAALSAAPLAAEGGSAWFIPVRGDIEPSLAAFVRRESQAAVKGGAAFLVYEIDTFGGRVDTALQISSYIGSLQDVRTVAWVRSGPDSMGVSWSAGALIALSCDDIFMAPGTSIGAAAPVSVGADGKTEALGEKTVSAVRSQMAALAEKNGHPAGIALAMVDMDAELWEIKVAGETRAATLAEVERLEKERPGEVERIVVVSPKGKLLSLTANEAERLGLARGIAEADADLLSAIGAAQDDSFESAPSVWDDLVALLASGPVQALLILVGLVALFLEINSPGFGIPGVVALIAFMGVFGVSALLGSVGSLELVLFLLGLALLAVEIFVLPGFGVAGVSGLVLISASLVFSMQDFVVPEHPWEWELLGRNLLVVALGLVAAIGGIAAIALAGPRIRLFDGLTLKTRITGTAGGPDPDAGPVPLEAPEPDEAAGYAGLVGKEGRAATTLRPAGKAEIDGRILYVEADGAFVEEGARIEVVRVRGNRIVVRGAAQRG